MASKHCHLCMTKRSRTQKYFFNNCGLRFTLEVILFSTNSKLTWEKFIYQIHEFIDQRNELTVIKLMVGLYR